MKPHLRKGLLAKKRRQEAAEKRKMVKTARENLSENSVPWPWPGKTYEEAYQATEGFRYSQNALLEHFLNA